MGKLAAYEKQMIASPDQQISLTDPDSRSMATSGRGSGAVGYNVQVAVDTEHHLIVTHEVTNSGSDRAQLANVAKQAKAVLQAETLEAVADRGYFNSPEILACHEAGITVTLPKPLTSGAKSDGRFGKQDFAICPRRMPIGALPASGCPIATPTRKPARCCGATGRRRARMLAQIPMHDWAGAAHHAMGARAFALSVRQRLMRTQCHAPAARNGRAPVRHDQGPDGRDTLPDQDAPEGRRGDGTLVLQSDARHEHRRHQADDGSDRSLTRRDAPVRGNARRPAARVIAQPRPEADLQHVCFGAVFVVSAVRSVGLDN